MDNAINIFGDSIAYGGYVENCWVDHLRKYLEKDTKNYFEVYNLGITGETTERLLRRFKIENEARMPNIIIIAIGTNDAKYTHSKDEPLVPVADFENNLLEIIKQSKQFSDEIVFMGITTVDDSIAKGGSKWIYGEYFDNENIKIYNRKIQEICQKNGLSFVDMIDALEMDDLEDGLHPNSVGHEKMFFRIRDFLVKHKIV